MGAGCQPRRPPRGSRPSGTVVSTSPAYARAFSCPSLLPVDRTDSRGVVRALVGLVPLVRMRHASYRPSGAGLYTRSRHREFCHLVHAFVVGFPDHVNGESMMVAGCTTCILTTGNLSAALTRIVLTKMACWSSIIGGVCTSSGSVASFRLRRFVVWSLPPTHVAKEERDDGDQLQRGPFPSRPYSHGSPLVYRLPLEHAPCRRPHGGTWGP